MTNKNQSLLKLLVILGPTASGKSDLAIKLAKLFKGEIISADSRQVYKGMDIGTGKVPISYEPPSGEFTKSSIPRSSLNNERRGISIYSEGIRHHLLDVADPNEYFSVTQYQKLALEAIQNIQNKGKLPILCGGTGLYLSVIIEGWQLPYVPPNLQLRQSLEKLTPEQLFEKLKTLDPKRAQSIDPHNKRRIIRALEIVSQNKTISPLKKITPPWEILILGIKKDKNELQELIKKRLLKRLDEGMIEEVKKLKEKGVSSKRLDDFGLEYRWINRYLEQKITYEEMVESLYRDICHYAKRQMTWFKKIPNLHWISDNEEAIKLTSDFLSN
jgi:tRNA dimethylallyltransferase